MISGHNYLHRTGRILLLSLLGYYLLGFLISTGFILYAVIVNNCTPCDDPLAYCMCPRDGILSSLTSGNFWFHLLVLRPIFWPSLFFEGFW